MAARCGQAFGNLSDGQSAWQLHAWQHPQTNIEVLRDLPGAIEGRLPRTSLSCAVSEMGERYHERGLSLHSLSLHGQDMTALSLLALGLFVMAIGVFVV